MHSLRLEHPDVAQKRSMFSTVGGFAPPRDGNENLLDWVTETKLVALCSKTMIWNSGTRSSGIDVLFANFGKDKHGNCSREQMNHPNQPCVSCHTATPDRTRGITAYKSTWRNTNVSVVVQSDRAQSLN
jgi:hypothetical protein